MMWMELAVIALAVAGAALLLLAQAARVAEREQARERLGAGEAGGAEGAETAHHRLARIRNPMLRRLCRRCWSAGWQVSPQQLMLACVGWAVLTLLLVAAFRAIGLLMALAIPVVAWLAVYRREQKQRQRINEQLPAFLGYVMRALSAGHTFEEALQNAAREASDPIAGVFASVSRQVQLGAEIDDTLAEVAGLYRLRALHILAMGARVNRRYGGSMRRIIATLVETIRQQEEAGRELKALTGETRFSAYVVATLPVAISAFFYLQNPSYYAAMLQSGGGRIAVVVALLLEAIGLFTIWRMVSRLKEPDQ